MQNRKRRDEVQRGQAISAEAEEFGAKFSDYNMIAAFQDMGEAKKAIDALQLAGLEAAEMELLGETANEAEEMTDKASINESDARLANDVIGSVVLWAGVGAAVGAVLGLVLSLFDPWPMGVWTSLAFGVIILGTLGGLVGGMSTLNAGPDAELPYRPVGEGHVLVGVLSTDLGNVDRAEEVLNKMVPLSLHRYDRRGEMRS